MKVLLVKPHSELKVAKNLERTFLHLEPLELEIVAGGVPEEEDVKIIDLSVEKKPLKTFCESIQNFKPHIIGFTAYSNNIHIVKKLAVIAKSDCPEAFTVVGGIHATLLPKDCQSKNIDAVVRGEGAFAIAEIVDKFKKEQPPWNGVNILNPKSSEFILSADKKPPKYVDINTVPAPRRDLVERSNYFCVWTHSDTNKLNTIFPRVASIRTSLGCPFYCSFCVIPYVMNRAYLQRDPEDVAEEISKLNEEYVYFVDDEMFIDMKRAEKIAILLKEKGVRKKYISWARSDTIAKNPEVFKLWKSVGLDVVYVGIESMNEKYLGEYNKKTSYQTNKKAVDILKEYNITLHAAFIVHPNFDENDFKNLEKDIDLISPSEITFTVLSPSPGTAFFKENEDKFICDPLKHYDCMHTVLPTKLSLKRFYQHFGRLYSLALRANPLRKNKVKIPKRELFYIIIKGTKYIFSLYTIYKDYPKAMWTKKGKELSDYAHMSKEVKNGM